jgi:cytidylate kinase
MQRILATRGSVVMDGRDIGSYVLPNAQVKIFQIASVETRAERRYKENVEKGIPTSLEDVIADVKKRDYIDSHRDFDPLTQAEDAVPLDTSYMTIEESVDAVLKIVKEKVGVSPIC